MQNQFLSYGKFCFNFALSILVMGHQLILFLLLILGSSWAQLCLEDVAVNEKLHDQKFVQRQLDCIMSVNDEQCDQFGVQLKRKFIFVMTEMN